jgi:predicted nucleic acid-binding protein
MKGPVLADTGPLYAAADPSDVHHHRALDELQQLARGQREVVVLFPILLEAYSLIHRRFDPKTTLRWLTEVGGSALINPSPEDYRQAFAKVHSYADQRLTLFDATLAVLAGRMGLPVWTYDHHFDVMRVPVWRQAQ